MHSQALPAGAPFIWQSGFRAHVGPESRMQQISPTAHLLAPHESGSSDAHTPATAHVVAPRASHSAPVTHLLPALRQVPAWQISTRSQPAAVGSRHRAVSAPPDGEPTQQIRPGPQSEESSHSAASQSGVYLKETPWGLAATHADRAASKSPRGAGMQNDTGVASLESRARQHTSEPKRHV
jgi:hypothetical protein